MDLEEIMIFNKAVPKEIKIEESVFLISFLRESSWEEQETQTLINILIRIFYASSKDHHLDPLNPNL